MMKLEQVLEHWRNKSISVILDHGQSCCTLAKEWFISMDKSLVADSNTLSGPKWLRERYRWGPIRRPLYWCDIVNVEALDCGAFAAITREIFISRGLTCLPVQLVQKFPLYNIKHWKETWLKAKVPFDWAEGPLVYHEAVAVVIKENCIEIWDPVDAHWMSLRTRGYGATIALRVVSDKLHSVVWKSRHIPTNQWIKLL